MLPPVPDEVPVPDEATVLAPRLALEREDTSLRKPVYSIIRKIDGKSVQTPAEQNAEVTPGDVVRVDIAPTRPREELRPHDEAAQGALSH